MLKFDAAVAENIGRGGSARGPRPALFLFCLCSQKEVLSFVWSGIAAKNYFFSRIRSFQMSYMLRGEEESGPKDGLAD